MTEVLGPSLRCVLSVPPSSLTYRPVHGDRFARIMAVHDPSYGVTPQLVRDAENAFRRLAYNLQSSITYISSPAIDTLSPRLSTQTLL